MKQETMVGPIIYIQFDESDKLNFGRRCMSISAPSVINTLPFPARNRLYLEFDPAMDPRTAEGMLDTALEGQEAGIKPVKGKLYTPVDPAIFVEHYGRPWEQLVRPVKQS